MTDSQLFPEAGGDPYELIRFVQAQDDDYERALAELKSDRKRSHWMWYIFPQFNGLGLSATAHRSAIQCGLEEYCG